jgi:hypothetical protein
MVASVFSLLSIPVVYLASQSRIDVAYAVYPGRTEIVQGGRLSDLSVLYKGAPISESVTSVAIQIWNNGKKPATSDPKEMPDPLRIIVKGSHRILTAKILHVSREICAIRLDDGKLSEGIVPVQFRILEHGDGATIQLIYEGDTAALITANGTFVGQPELLAVTFGNSESAKTAGSHPIEYTIRKIFLLIVLVVFAAGGVFLARTSVAHNPTKFERIFYGSLALLVFAAVALVGYAIYPLIVINVPLSFD